MHLLLERMHRILNFNCIGISNIIFSLWILIAIFDRIFEAIFIYCTYLYYTCYDSPNILKSSSILHKLQNFSAIKISVKIEKKSEIFILKEKNQ
jgi:hypothetical protein